MMMKEKKTVKNNDSLEKWEKENQSHGAFALTKEELDFYFKDRSKTPIW